MSKSNYFETAFLKLIFYAEPILGLADDAAIAPVTSLSVALHTADPGEAGVQSNSEIVYTGYVRKAVARDNTAWLVSGSNAYPINTIEFNVMSGGLGGIAKFASVGDGITDNILWSGPISPNLNVVNGVIPRLKGLAWFASGQASSIAEE